MDRQGKKGKMFSGDEYVIYGLARWCLIFAVRCQIIRGVVLARTRHGVFLEYCIYVIGAFVLRGCSADTIT